MCTVFEDEESIFNALKAGASGYILKNVTIDELVKHIREIYAGLSPMSGLIARKVIMHFQQPTMSDEARSLLSPREQEVLQYLSRGLRYKEIASKVNLSAETVRTHIRNIYIKLQVDNKTEAINKVYRR
ncbi:MAG: response regulator transcription factor [Crocinitomicaceae bacterium]|nr:response regulator transcription factor [Crocinitomicaceae bacterium]